MRSTSTAKYTRLLASSSSTDFEAPTDTGGDDDLASITGEADLEMSPSLGTFRACYVVALCSIGSFLFAYDTGIVGGVLTLSSFQRDFRYTKKEKTQVNSNCVSILQGGAFFGCFLIWPVTSWLGRKWGIIVSSLVFCVGAILQIINTHSLGLFYAGRVISGLGTGGATVMVPMMAAEFAPKNLRGRLGACFQLFFATGVCVSYWVDYAASSGVPSSKSTQWQIPIGLQLVPGGLLGLGMLLIKESPRWLAKKGRNEEAYNSLVWVRGGIDTSEVQAEFQEILAGVQVEIQASEGFTYKELLLPSNRYRIFLAITIQLAAQLSGNTSLAYFAPQFFSLLGTGDKSVFITGFFGLVKIAGVVTYIIFLVDRFGRRQPLMGGALLMGIFMLIVGIIIVTHPPNAKEGISSAGAAGIAMIYLEAFTFNFSWGPGILVPRTHCLFTSTNATAGPWLYIGEIFPNRIREIGIASGAASQVSDQGLSNALS